MGKQVLILHGWRNRRVEGHWQRLSAATLRKQGHHVFYPQLPDSDEPNFADWSEVILAELQLMREASNGDELVVIGHSLGAVTWLKLVGEGLIGETVDRVLLVAPADPKLLTDLPDFALDLENISTQVFASSDSTTLVGSDADDWIPNGIEQTFGEPLALTPVILAGAGHLAYLDGFGQWAGVVNWVNDPNEDLTLR